MYIWPALIPRFGVRFLLLVSPTKYWLWTYLAIMLLRPYCGGIVGSWQPPYVG